MRVAIVWALIPVLAINNCLAVDGSTGPAPISRPSKALEWKNIELTNVGELVGQAVNRNGQPIAEANLIVEQRGQKQTIIAGEDGRFAIKSLKSGPCVVTLGEEIFACRVWQKQVAPPGSLRSLAVVSSSDVVRGNLLIPRIQLPLIPHPRFPTGLGTGMGSKFGLALLGVGGAAIAIGASQDDDDNAS